MPGTVLDLKNKLTGAIDREGNVRTDEVARITRSGCVNAQVLRSLAHWYPPFCFATFPQVRDMAAVLEVIGLLEQTTVTAEELQVSYDNYT